MLPSVQVRILYLFGALLCLGTGVTSRRTFFNPKHLIEQDLVVEKTANTTFVCPGTGNYPVPGKECTEDYYSCATGSPVAMVCAGASVFEPSTNVCTSSSTAPCKKSTTTTTMTPTTTMTLTTTTPTRISTTTTPTDVPFDCQDNGAYPNPSNCNTFYMCSNGIAYLYFCPSNLVFNPTTGNCDYPSNVSGPCAGAL
ncbi:probable endochitinase isoform X2 [Daphnia carinata]|uniref:probable endochitinase isoform X2 n=1 Tax=Daphnia carinata TaxID=120202 RepID=UPI0025811745|nr:probable endochitinase isoform X2 [Daphnia carinata]